MKHRTSPSAAQLMTMSTAIYFSSTTIFSASDQTGGGPVWPRLRRTLERRSRRTRVTEPWRVRLPRTPLRSVFAESCSSG